MSRFGKTTLFWPSSTDAAASLFAKKACAVLNELPAICAPTRAPSYVPHFRRLHDVWSRRFPLGARGAEGVKKLQSGTTHLGQPGVDCPVF